MGKTIEHLAKAKGHEIAAIINSENDDFWKGNLSEKADVAVEFTHPEAGYDNIKRCLENGLPVISGTTGWIDKMDDVISTCQKHNGAFFYASNFSLGVNIFFEINTRLAAIMDEFPQYEVFVEEIHHTSKKDAPSGTAITIANSIIDNLKRKSGWERENMVAFDDLAIKSKRIDPAPGTHIIDYSSKIDSIEIKHTAHSREGFAQGALMAAEWLVGRKGVFGMKDLLGLGG